MIVITLCSLFTMEVRLWQKCSTQNWTAARLRSFETELGSWVLAVEPAAELADLSAAQLAQLQALEVELGVVLLAYTPPA
jgi:hypothetical protein